VSVDLGIMGEMSGAIPCDYQGMTVYIPGFNKAPQWTAQALTLLCLNSSPMADSSGSPDLKELLPQLWDLGLFEPSLPHLKTGL
jgi:hypothetical protein